MDSQMGNLVRVSVADDRKWKIAGLILTVICLGSYILLAITLFKHFNSSDPVLIPSITNTTNDNGYSTSINLHHITTPDVDDITTMIVNQAVIYQNYTLSDPIKYNTSLGRSLGNSVYVNTNWPCIYNGYVSSVYLRLFTNWEDNAPLYIFIITGNWGRFAITTRYPIRPQRDTTEWQTINIPSYALPIYYGNMLGIGMQDGSNTNQIYLVKSAAGISILGIRAIGIDNNTVGFSPDAEDSFKVGFALGYTMAYNAETTTTSAVSIG